MRLKVLGAYGASDAEHNLTGYLLDDWLAVDAGTLTSKLSFAQQSTTSVVLGNCGVTLPRGREHLHQFSLGVLEPRLHSDESPGYWRSLISKRYAPARLRLSSSA